MIFTVWDLLGLIYPFIAEEITPQNLLQHLVAFRRIIHIFSRHHSHLLVHLPFNLESYCEAIVPHDSTPSTNIKREPQVPALDPVGSHLDPQRNPTPLNRQPH